MPSWGCRWGVLSRPSCCECFYPGLLLHLNICGLFLSQEVRRFFSSLFPSPSATSLQPVFQFVVQRSLRHDVDVVIFSSSLYVQQVAPLALRLVLLSGSLFHTRLGKKDQETATFEVFAWLSNDGGCSRVSLCSLRPVPQRFGSRPRRSGQSLEG